MRFFLLFFVCIAQLSATGRELLLNLVAGEWASRCVYTAAELDLASHLSHGPQSITQLAEATKTDENSLYRLMRTLASVGIFYEEGDRCFRNTGASVHLASDSPQSLRSLILFYSQEMSESLKALTKSIRSGKPGFDLTFHQSVFDYFRDHPSTRALFHAAMQEKSQAVITSCLKSYDFSQFTSVFDIGAGVGHFLSAILDAYHHTQGVLFDLPEVASCATTFISRLEPRCSVVPGNFFEHIPPLGDAYLLKSVLHDWDDENSLKILRKCHEAMSDASKLIVIEPLITSPNQPELAKMMDVYMMTITGGKERTAAQFQELLAQAGFTICSITPTETEFHIIEAIRNPSAPPSFK